MSVAVQSSGSGVQRPSSTVMAIRVLIVVIALLALASPIYVALFGTGYLNQPPPPSWGHQVSQPSTTTGGRSGPASFGGC